MQRRSVRVRRTMGKLLASVACIAVALLGLPSASGAHSANEPLLYLDFTDIAVGGRVEFPTTMIEELLGLPLEGRGQELIPQLEADLPLLQAYADEHFDFIVDGESKPLTWEGLDILYEDGIDSDLNFVDLGFTVEGLDGEIPRVFEVRFDPFFDVTDDSTALLLIGNDIQGGIFDNGEDWLIDFDDDNRTRAIDLGDASQWNNFSSSVSLGVDHIKTGPDHILFILVLLLPSVLVFRNGWLPGDSFGSSLWRILKIVTMFTVAHTITFSLAGLDILPLPPSKLVESIIAVSIALAALHNIKPIAPNKEWAIAFGFGLFHGMGFATLVEGLDVSRQTQLVSLLGRNIGIEIGQTVVVLVSFSALFLLRRTRFYQPLFVGSSLLLAAVALGWMYERVFEVDLGINGFVDPFFEFPRILIPVALGTIVAAGLHQWEATRGRHLPTAGMLARSEVEVQEREPATV